MTNGCREGGVRGSIDGAGEVALVRTDNCGNGRVTGLVSDAGVGCTGDSSGGNARRNGTEYSGKVAQGVLSKELESDAKTVAKVEVNGKWERELTGAAAVTTVGVDCGRTTEVGCATAPPNCTDG